jgi:hypothetical protein
MGYPPAPGYARAGNADDEKNPRPIRNAAGGPLATRRCGTRRCPARRRRKQANVFGFGPKGRCARVCLTRRHLACRRLDDASRAFGIDRDQISPANMQSGFRGFICGSSRIWCMRFRICQFGICVLPGVGWERLMNAVQAFLLGMMAAWTPSLVILGWILREVPVGVSLDDTEH